MNRFARFRRPLLAALPVAAVLAYALWPTRAPNPAGPPPNYAAARAAKDSAWRVGPDSPLPDSAREVFRGLRYFPPRPDWRLTARYDPLPNGGAVLVPLRHSDAPEPYLRAARLTFVVAGETHTLIALRKLNDPATAPLFVPFTDGTTGRQTYGGGRYLDVMAPAPGQTTVLLDFNRAYAPLCAHVPDYQCPIPLAENALRVTVTAGERE